MAEKKNKGGRPSKYDSINIEQLEKMAKCGLIDEQMADILGISVATFNNYKKNPEFLESLKRGKDVADARIVRALYERAKGYEHDDVHISNYQGEITETDIVKHYAPDTTACIFWLKNRQPKNWRDRHELTGADGAPLAVQTYSMPDNGREVKE